ncbi:MAG TPA: family 78 glycoside hydrolase catalytic domain [Ilumatobacteraceae bacterium]|nr:family 78 glycoside hydrolase catalytic domain [Ilumatobacteraceae bacterium]
MRQLRAEYGANPCALGTAVPRLSWHVESDQAGCAQRAYEIALNDRESDVEAATGVVGSADSVLVEWPFEPLRSRARRQIRVRVTTSTDDVSDWSDPLDIEVGLIDPSDWTAVPITATFADTPPERPVRFRRTFSVRSGLVRARLYASALGIYTVECNGASVGDDVLAPGWTSYHHRLRYQTLDVTSAIHEGDNALGVTVAEGWYRGRLGFRGGRREVYGTDVGPVAQLELHYDDGTIDVVATDRQWRAGLGPHIAASLYDGETYDARLVDPAWSTPDFDDRDWVEASERASVAHLMAAPTGPPVRRIETIRPVSIEASPGGATIVDFGQNISGRVRIRVGGPAGGQVVMRHAEVLEHGELGTRPLRGAAQTDTYVLAGDGVEIYEPTFTIHGFRYVEVDGWPGELTTDAINAVVCHSDMEPTGTFHSSHEGLDRLHENVRWSMRGNFVDLPTDCPQRDERLGWTGDIQVFAPTASFLYDSSGFLTSWLQDLADEQHALGTVPAYVPWIDLRFRVLPAAAWGDAAVVVPWVLYERFGDVDLLRRQYDSMCAWVDQIATIAGENHRWDTGFQFGDWLDPAAPPDDPGAARTDKTLVATAYHAHTARLLVRVADVLGRDADRTRYSQLADRIVEAFNAEFVTSTGRLASDAQTAYALALQFGLLATESQRVRAGSRLAQLVSQEGFCIGTGFVGTPLVCDALVDAGYVDEAYHLLLQERCPSWLYPVTMGATTVWERWDSMLPDGSINPGDMTSFNHYALGAVADFLHRVVAGLAPAEPGYRELLVHPRPGGGLTEAGTTLRTPYGDARVHWHRPGDRLVVDIVVPVGSTARVELPGCDPVEVGSGAHQFDCECRPAALDPPIPPRPSPFGDVDDAEG